MTFLEQLKNAWTRNDSLVCVGLDPELEKFPASLSGQASPIFQLDRKSVV